VTAAILKKGDPPVIKINKDRLIADTDVISGNEYEAVLNLPAEGGGIYLPEIVQTDLRYMTFFAEARQEHSVVLNMLLFSKKNPKGEPIFNLRFGIMPKVRALICIDLNLLDGHILFPGNNEGQLKVVCHGRRVDKSEVGEVRLSSYPSFHDIELVISNIEFSDEEPKDYPLPDIKLIDEMGQYKLKDWPGKMKSPEQMKEWIFTELGKISGEYSAADWDQYGGWKKKKLTQGTGYFSKVKKDGKWWLVDPLGNAFFSIGPDCVVIRPDCRIDGLEKFMDWLPERDDPKYKDMYSENSMRLFENKRRKPLLFSFEQSNLYRTFGYDWYEKWKRYITGMLKNHGMNTLGNWSDEKLFGGGLMPYVSTLPRFPSTDKKIFRDFPDVFSEEYKKNAAEAAKYLSKYKDDSYMIGYFLGNEPSWAFVDNLVIADEVLYNLEMTECKKELIKYLSEKYIEVSNLNAAWGKGYKSFDELYERQKDVSKWTKRSREDMIEFSKIMLEKYIAVPSDACKKAAPNHMNLGIRWAWISDEIVVTGWEHFDVFSINCYAVDPTEDLDGVTKLNVDLPIMIGEFHFGALDAGLTATGLEAVKSQTDRGKAFRYYAERVAAHPNGVGCHYFQCYDQFELGRFDGENYNIGLFDICSLPHEEIMGYAKDTGVNIYEVADGKKKPYGQKPETIPMIAY
jgi:hypothetical protein